MNVVLSIVIPYRNQQHTLERCLKSIYEQNLDANSFEVIVVDNNDQEQDAVHGHYPIRWIRNDVPGAARARNKGARAAIADLLLFIDSDCVVSSGLIIQMIRPFFSWPELDAVVGNKKYVFEKKNGVTQFFQRRLDFLSNYVLSGEGRAFFLDSACFCVRKSTFFDLGGFNSRLKRFEDRDFGLQLLAKRKIVYQDFQLPPVLKLSDTRTVINYFFYDVYFYSAFELVHIYRRNKFLFPLYFIGSGIYICLAWSRNLHRRSITDLFFDFSLFLIKITTMPVVLPLLVCRFASLLQEHHGEVLVQFDGSKLSLFPRRFFIFGFNKIFYFRYFLYGRVIIKISDVQRRQLSEMVKNGSFRSDKDAEISNGLSFLALIKGMLRTGNVKYLAGPGPGCGYENKFVIKVD